MAKHKPAIIEKRYHFSAGILLGMFDCFQVCSYILIFFLATYDGNLPHPEHFGTKSFNLLILCCCLRSIVCCYDLAFRRKGDEHCRHSVHACTASLP